jgi:hypothetical protein
MDRSQQPPEQPSPPPPSYAAQLLTVTARILELLPDAVANPRLVNAAYDIATDAILTPVPAAAVVQDSAQRAESALRPYDGLVCGEYAARLRAAAKRLG